MQFLNISPRGSELRINIQRFHRLPKLRKATVAFLEPIQARHAELVDDPGEVLRGLRASADRAREIAVSTMTSVREAVGLLLS